MGTDTGFPVIKSGSLDGWMYEWWMGKWLCAGKLKVFHTELEMFVILNE